MSWSAAVRLFVMVLAIIFSANLAYADNFNRAMFYPDQYSVRLGSMAELPFATKLHSPLGLDYIIAEPGALAECNMLTEKDLLPKELQWMRENGLVEESSITRTLGLSPKILSQHTGRMEPGKRILVIGCWVVQNIVSKSISGDQKYYVKVKFKINDLIVNSPFLERAVCVANDNPQRFYWKQGGIDLRREGKCHIGRVVSLDSFEKANLEFLYEAEVRPDGVPVLKK